MPLFRQKPPPLRSEPLVVESVERRVLYAADLAPAALGLPAVLQHRVLDDDAVAPIDLAAQRHELVVADARVPTEDPRRSLAAGDGIERDVVAVDADEDGLARVAGLLRSVAADRWRVVPHVDADGRAALGRTDLARLTATELVVVDDGIAGADALVADLQAQAAQGRHLEVLRLAAGSDGIAEIGAALAARQDLAALHIVSHGRAGALQLGASVLDAATLRTRAADVAAWRTALAPDADLMLYGCDVAAGARGAAFVDRLAALTGADIAASDDATGGAARGGNWTLERTRGHIEASLAIDAAGRAAFDGLLASFTVTNTSNSGAGSLRQAIIDANNAAGADSIAFAIPGTGVHTITLASNLPQITGTVTLDATTDDSFAANGNRPAVVVDFNGVASSGFSLGANADGSTIRGLAIRRYGSAAITIVAGSDGNTIAGNYIGALDTDGQLSGGSSTATYGLYVGGANNLIGGSSAADRNVIAHDANGSYGVLVNGASATGNVLRGNYIGTDASGTVAAAYNTDAVSIQSSAADNTIGGPAAGDGNVIATAGIPVYAWSPGSGNLVQGNRIGISASGTLLGGHTDGVRIDSGGMTVRDNWIGGGSGMGIRLNSASGSTLLGNRIGTDLAGTANWGTQQSGIYVNGSNNQIGGSGIGQGNTVANANRAASTHDGITVAGGTGNALLGNSVYGTGSGGLGIDLGTSGVTANDAGDGDTGANRLQNFPLLTRARTDGRGQFEVAGSLNSSASSYYRIEFFASPAANASGNGEGQTWLGAVNVATDASGNASFQTTLSANVAAGAVISATATKSDAAYASFTDTSEFSANASAQTTVLVVDTTADTVDGTTTDLAALLAAKGADGHISLREAVTAANNTAGLLPVRIEFGIAGTGVHTISLGSALPTVTRPVVIDGSTDDSFAANGSRPAIELLGTGAFGFDGITLGAGSSGSTVRGLALGAFNAGIAVQSNNNTIAGNHAGVRADGTSLQANSQGVYVTGSGNTIGGSTAADRNVLSGNVNSGVMVGGANNVITGNYLGTDATGTLARGNGLEGAYVYLAAGNRVGGTAPGEGNVIGGNGRTGVLTMHSTTVQGNWIGTDTSGTLNLANGTGIWLSGAQTAGTMIGGTSAAAANVIAFNTGDGLNTDASSARFAVLGNAFYGNGDLAIDLRDDGVTANDAGDADTGPNGLQNFPVLTLARTNGGSQLTVAGSFNGAASSYFRIEFYASPSADATGYGEGRTFLGFLNVATDASGNATIATTLAVNVAAGSYVSATATRSDAGYASFTDTSEFGRSIMAIASTQVTAVVDTAADTSDGDTTSWSTLLANRGADGFISLREAITAANQTTNGSGGPDRIHFGIAGTGVHTISLGAALPSITEAVVIDGSTDDSFAANGNRPAVVLRGDASLTWTGLQLADSADGSTVRGLVLQGFGIAVDVVNGSSGNTIAGNFIGRLGADGSIGGSLANDYGIVVRGSGNLIGGSAAGDANVVTGNLAGIVLETAGASGNRVSGNLVGTAADGSFGALTGGVGISVMNGAHDNRIGGTAAGDGNRIAGNVGSGVTLEAGAGTGNSVLGNRIDGNGDIGIDLGLDGPTANDAGDADTGANGLQNTPVLTQVSTDGAGDLRIAGVLDSTAGTHFRIELFWSATAHASGHGDGATFIGFVNVTTDAGGHASFSVTPGAVVPAGAVVSATATVANAAFDSFGDSSEFSAAATAAPPPAHVLPAAPTVAEDGVLALSGLSISQPGGNSASTQLGVAHGVLTLDLSGGATVTAGANGSAALTIGGTLAQVNAALATLQYRPAADWNGADLLSLTTTDPLGMGDSDTLAITVGAVNDAPVLTPPSPVLTTLDENAITNTGQTVASIVGSSIADVDAGAVQGIAITGLASGNGAWQSSIDGGTTWSAIGTASDTNALLLRATDRVRFVPDGQNATAASFDFRAWDQSTGTAGGRADASMNGGTTAFSSASDTASISVTAVNDAPVLTPGAPALTSITEDATANVGQTVASIVGGLIGDVDTGAIQGIAITGLAAGNGAWQYSTDGGTSWSAIGSASDTNALLLRATDRVRFVPDGQNATAAGFDFRAWDRTTGTAGGRADASTNGGATAFSSASDTASITVSAVNDAPVLTPAAPVLTTLDEDATANPGQTVASIVGGLIGDVDTGAVQGIAITGLASGNGAWQYSTDGGTSWSAIGSASDTNALLLRATDRVRFVPDGQNATAASFDFRAWDQSTGTAGGRADASTNGGATAFSSASDTASITVTAVNDAPVLTPAAPALAAIDEDATANPGQTVASIVGGSITDVDAAAAQGIAVTGLAAGNGAWQYSTDGGTSWSAVGSASDANALLLRVTDSVRFVPDGQNATTASFDFRAWDQSTGTAGGRADASSNGGTTAFSNASDTASISVTAVNDAPVQTSAAPALTALDENATANPGQTVASIVGSSITDVDAGAVQGIAITGLASGNGAWQYSTDGGTSWSAIGSANDANALLLRVTDRVRFVPDGQNATTASFDFRAWDQSTGTAGGRADASSNGGTTAFSNASDTASISVTAVNDAPVLTPAAPVLATIDENATTNAGQTVASIVGSSITDVDAGAVQGIAITGLTSGNGAWQYSTDGGTSWSAVGSASDANALLLRATDHVRFVPDGQNATAASFDFRAWDGSSGTAGGRGDASTNGGTTAFSSASDTASITITAVNDAPVLTPAAPMLATIDEDATTNPGQTVASIVGSSITDVDAGAVQGIAITGLASGIGAWQFSTDAGSSWSAIVGASDGNALLLRAADRVRFVPDAANGGTATLSYRAWDQASGSAGTRADASAHGGSSAFGSATDTATLTITDVNDAPVLTPSAPVLPPIDEDASGNGGQTVASFTAGRIADVDSGAPAGIAVVATGGSGGSWWYSTDGGTSWQAVGSVAAHDALLLRSGDLLRLEPTGVAGGTATLGFRAWDQSTGSAGGRADATVHGGSTAFSSASDTASLAVVDVNSAPVLAPAAPALPGLGEDDGATSGHAVATLIAGRVTDVDPGALRGIAITGAAGANGSWQASLDGGTSWQAIGGVGDTSALLLRDTDLVRFVPDGRNGGTATLDFRAWDRSSGQAGDTVDTTAHGGTTAFSSAADRATLAVADINDAPVLAPAAPSLPGLTEDDTDPAGWSVAALLGGQVSDVDAGALQGIAVTAVAGSHGAWEVSLDGGASWQAVAGASEGDALLLRATDLVRWRPDGVAGGSATLQVRAWDGSAGAAGGRADARVHGGTTAFSADSDTATVQVVDVNDAPQLTPAAPSLGSVGRHAAAGSPVDVAALLGTRAVDIDGGAVAGIALTGAGGPGAGRWRVSTDGGAHWADVGAVDPAAALLLRLQDQLRFVPDVGATGPATLTLRAWDGSAGSAGQRVDARSAGARSAFSSATDTATLAVVDDNHAPVLAPRQADLAPSADAAVLQPAGLTVAALLAGHASDADGDPVGIALIGAAASGGRWELSTDGGGLWQALPATAEADALLLDGTARLRFVAGDGAASGALDVRAWDGSTGQAGGRADARSHGGGSAFSDAADQATLRLEARHHAPQGRDGRIDVVEAGHVFGRGDFGFTDPQDTPADAFAAVRVDTLPARGTLALDGRAVQAGERIALADIDAGRLVYHAAPGGDATLAFRVQDDGGTTRGGADTDALPRRLQLHAVAAPVLDGVTLAVVQGGSTPLSTAAIAASDADTPFAELVFRIDAVSHGRFELLRQPGTAIDRFSGAQLRDGELRFVHDGSAQAPGFVLQVDDGLQRSQPVSARVVFTPQAPAPAPAPAAPLPGLAAPVPPVVTLPALPAAPAPTPGDGVATAPAPAAPGDAATPDAAPDDDEPGSTAPAEAPARPLPPVRDTAAAGTHRQAPAGGWARGGWLPTAPLPPTGAGPALVRELQGPREPGDAALGPGLPAMVDGDEAAPRWLGALRPIAGGSPGGLLRGGGDEAGAEAGTPPLQTASLQLGLEFGYVAVSTGVVWWATRAGGLLASMLAAAPGWRHVDPLPILGDDAVDELPGAGPEPAEDLDTAELFEAGDGGRG